MARKLLVAVLACCVMTAAAAAAPVRFDGTGNYYEAVRYRADWARVAREAASRRFTDGDGNEYVGRLVTINSQAESDFIAANFPRAAREGGYWIGALQQDGSTEPGEGWRWVSGEPFEFTNWASNEPNNNSGDANENRIHLNSTDAEWNDLPAGKRMSGYVVEYLPTNRPPVADAGGPYSATADDVFADVDPDVINLRAGARFVNAYLTADPDAEAEVQLDGSGSSDPDGDELTCAWSVLDADGNEVATVTGADATVSLAPGSYTARLIVNDGQVDSEPDTAEIEVAALDLTGLSAGDVTACGPVGDPVPGERCEMEQAGTLKVQFSGEDVRAGLVPDQMNVITLCGAVSGQDTVRVINPGPPDDPPGKGKGKGKGKGGG
ncbi:MAG: lectin-like protein [Candidatus Brocadiia bacterium]